MIEGRSVDCRDVGEVWKAASILLLAVDGSVACRTVEYVWSEGICLWLIRLPIPPDNKGGTGAWFVAAHT